METYSVKAILSAVDSNFTSTMKTANNSLAGIKSASEGATSSIMKIASGIGVFKALSASANLVKSSISSAMGRQDTMEAFNRTITQITGSAENATKALEELKGITKGTAYGLDVAAKATQNFVTRGMDLSKATKSVGIWTDAVSFYGKGTNEQLETVTDALAKMRTKGTVEMEQLSRLFDVGINATGIYAKAVGRNAADVADDLSAKTITTEQFLDVVEKAMAEGTNGVDKIAGAALKAGASWTGTIDNMKAATTRGVLSIMQAIDDMLSKNKLPQMREMISQFGKGAEATMNAIANGIKNLKDVGALIPQIGALGSALFVVGGSVDYIRALGGGFDLLSTKVSGLKNSMSGLPKYLAVLKGTFIDSMSKLMPSSVKKRVLGNLLGIKMNGILVSQQLGDAFDKVSSKIPDKFMKMGSGIGKGLKKSTDVGMKSLSLMSSGLNKVFAFALKSVGPAAILGLVVAGLGIINNQFGSQIDQMISTVTTKGPEIIKKFVKSITSQLPALANQGTQLVVKLALGISSMLPLVINAGISIINGLVKSFSDNAGLLVRSALLIIGTLGGAILNAVPQLLGMGLQVLTSITQGILDNMPLILTGIKSMITNITTSIQTQLPTMLQMGVQILQNIATGIVQMLPQLVVGAIQIITTLINTISENLPTILNGAVEIINTLVDGLINNLPQIIDATVELIGAILNAIITNLPQIMTAGVQIILKLVSGLISAIPHVISGVAKIAKKIISTFKDTNWLEIGINIIKGIAKGIASAAGQLWDAAKKALGSFKDKVLGFFGIHSPSRWGKWVGKMIDTGFAKGVGNNIRLISNQAQKMFDTVQSYVFDVNTLGMNLSFADGLSGTLDRYVEYNDRYIDDEGGNDDNTEYNFNITTEIDGKTAGKAMAKYTKEELDRMDKHSRRLRGDI